MNMTTVDINASITKKTKTCPIHGAYESTCYAGCIWTPCPTCKQERDAEERERAASALQHDKKIARHIALEASGMPPRFRNCTADTFETVLEGQQRAFDTVQSYVEGFRFALEDGRSMLFSGSPGTGKTHLACAIGAHLINQDWNIHFTTFSGMMRRVKDAWRRDSAESEGLVVKAFVSPHLLIVDELEFRFASDTERAITFEIFNARYEHRRPSLLISNLPPKDALSILGERVADRLIEDGLTVVPFQWRSYRGKNAN